MYKAIVLCQFARFGGRPNSGRNGAAVLRNFSGPPGRASGCQAKRPDSAQEDAPIPLLICKVLAEREPGTDSS